ncbi:putative lipoprotein, partial [Chlamydia psittaci 84-8471/1]
ACSRSVRYSSLDTVRDKIQMKGVKIVSEV